MSNDENLDLDLASLFQPAWAQGSIEQNLLKKFGNADSDREHRSGERRSGGGRHERDGQRRPRRDGDGQRHGARRDAEGQRRGGGGRGGRDFDRQRKGGGGGCHGQRFEQRAPVQREEPAPLPDVEVEFLPVEKSAELLAAQIKTSARAYPLFKLALMLLEKPAHYSVRLTAKKSHQSLFVCALDDSPWTKENEAVLHVLKNHLATFYQAEKVPVEPPKGVYTFVAQYDNVLLGPPNYHDYQIKLRELHAERGGSLPFEVFRSRVKISKDEALLNQWREEQSFKTEYVALNVSEPLRFTTLDEVSRHFRDTHKEHIITRVETLTVSGTPSRRLACSGLQRLVRRDWEQLRRHPLPFATKLSQQLAHHGLHFFKVNKTVTYVNLARPKYLDLDAAPVADGLKRVVEYLRAHKKCSRKKLVRALGVPQPPPPTVSDKPVEVDPLAAVGEISASLETPAVAEQPAEVQVPPPVEPAVADTQPSPSAPDELTPEQQTVLADLHWLVHQGFVVEYADGHVEAAHKPAVKPQPNKAPAAADSQVPAVE